MSLKSIVKSIFASSAARAIETIVVTDTQKAVAAFKATPMGAAIAADIAALKDARLTGLEKFERVVANTAPALLALLTSKGAAGVVLADVDSITRELVQSVYNDTRSTKAGQIATLALTLLKAA